MSEAVRPLLVIRVDAGLTVGTGHVMRCLALGHAMRERGASVAFLGKAPPAIIDRVLLEGFSWHQLVALHPDPADLVATHDFLEQQVASWVVLDGYHFTPEYQKTLRRSGVRLLVVDDDARHDGYEADILLNQNLGSENLTYHFASPDTRTLLGPRFALLRPEFVRSTTTRIIPDRAAHLLITMGGTDPVGGSFLALKALRQLDRSGLTIRIITGLDNPRNKELREAAIALGPSVEVLAGVGNMAEQFAWADMALAASGSTVWEMCCLGLPMLLVVTADNQRGIAAALQQRKAAVVLGEAKSVSPESLHISLNGMRNNVQQRRSLSKIGRRLVDGRGAKRVAQILLDSL